MANIEQQTGKVESPAVVTDEDVTRFVTYMVECAPPLKVDDKGYVRVKETNENVYIGIAGANDTVVKRPIIVYNAKITDPEAAILNPFAEGITKTATSDWFYSIVVGSAANMTRMIQSFLLKYAVESQDKKNKPKDNNIKLAGIVSKWVAKVDATTISEFDQMTKKVSDYMDIYYLAKHREARIACGILKDDFKTAHKKIRVKTWEVIEEQLKSIFDTTDFDEFSVVSKISACPRLDATLRVVLKIYTMISKYMEYLPDNVKDSFNHKTIDLDYLSRSIDLLEVFKAKSKHVVSSAVSPVPGATPAQNPVAAMTGTFNQFGGLRPITASRPMGLPVLPGMQQPNNGLVTPPPPSAGFGMAVGYGVGFGGMATSLVNPPVGMSASTNVSSGNPFVGNW